MLEESKDIFFSLAVYCIFLWQQLLTKLKRSVCSTKISEGKILIFAISDLQRIDYNNNSDILCFVDDSRNFSEQFLFYGDLTGPCTEMILGRGMEIPAQSQPPLSYLSKSNIKRSHSYFIFVFLLMGIIHQPEGSRILWLLGKNLRRDANVPCPTEKLGSVSPDSLAV